MHWVWCISPILFDVGIPNLGWWFLLGWQSGAYHFGSLWPWHWLLASFLGFSCLEHISYITAYFPQMCLMLDQFLWGHLSRVCDISCLVLNFFYRSPMFYFKENCNFPRGGLSFFPRGGRGVAWLQWMCRPNGRGVWGHAPPEKFSVLDCPNMDFAIISHL